MSTPSKELLSAVFNTTVKNIELDRGQTENKTDGKVSADSTSINLFNKKDKK